MYYCFLQTQLNRLQHIQNAPARAVVAALTIGPPCSPDYILRSMHRREVQ